MDQEELIQRDYSGDGTLLGNIYTLIPPDMPELYELALENPKAALDELTHRVSLHLAKRINPILLKKIPQLDLLREQLLKVEFKGRSRRLLVKTRDDELIDTIWLGPLEPKKFLVLSVGSGCCYEEVALQKGVLRCFVEFLLHLFPDMAILIPNTRGVGRSTGAPRGFSDLYKDFEAVLRYLVHNERVSRKDLLLYCHSLGGIAGIHNYGVNILVDRTFSRLPHIIAACLGVEKDSLTTELIARAADYLGWDANLLEAIQEVRKSACEVVVLYAENDQTIPLRVSLGHGIEQEGIAIATACLGPYSKNPLEEHTRILTEEETFLLYEQILRLYQQPPPLFPL